MVSAAYTHKVQYYETDRMGIVHHSNYIRWMEESRVSFFASVGWPYDKLESMGMVSPVVSVNCKYKTPSYFGDEITIKVSLEEYRSARIRYSYIMLNQEGKVVCEAESEHCVLNEKGMPTRLSRAFPEFFADIEKLDAENSEL